MTALLTWRCHICARERPDDKISVHTHDVVLDGSQFRVALNVRYCNDTPACIAAAPTYSFFRRATVP